MGSTIFKGKLGKKGLVKGATYKVGSLSYDQKLADELVDRFIKEDWVGRVMSFCDYVEKVYFPQLRTYPDLDGQGFIDAVIRRLENKVDFLHAKHVSSLLNPIVSLLHELEYRNVTLDLGGIFGVQETVVDDIAATEERQLSLVLRLAENPRGFDAINVAHRLKHCNVRLVGSAQNVGFCGFHSDYTLEKNAKFIGNLASNCMFRFPNVVDAVYTNKYPPVYFENLEVPGYYLPLRFDMTRGDEVFKVSVESGFFRRGNKLLIPDGPGKWKEVRPE